MNTDFFILNYLVMRRYPFFLGPLLGIVAFFFLFKVLLAALFGLMVFGLMFMAVRAVAGRRLHHAYQTAGYFHRPTPLDGDYREPGFPYGTSQQRIVEII